MSKKLELTGQRFDRLLVLGEEGRSKCGSVLWKVRCDCGVEKVVAGSSMRKGDTRSCGCYVKEIVKYKIDLLGRKFGRWLVLKEFGKDKYGKILWECVCECGTKRVVYGHGLREGQSKGCGKKLCHNNYKDGLSHTKEYSKELYKQKQLQDDPLHAFSNLKHRAKRAGTSFKWLKEDWLEWYPEQPRTCAYCDRPIKRLYGKGLVSNSISIDRKDPHGPYSKENCILCCHKCNLTKNDIFTYEEMKEIGQRYLKPKWQSNAEKETVNAKRYE